jgi:hypothetical protein
MSFENLDLTDDLQEEPTPPEESSNRTFLIIAGVLGAIALMALVCIAVYALVLAPGRKNSQNSQRATLEAQGTAVQDIIDKTSTAAEMAAIIAAYTATPTNTSPPPTFTATASQTPVVLVPTTALVLASTFTARPSQATSIPNTGFAEDIGLPAMLGMAVLLVVVIFLARRLRSA